MSRLNKVSSVKIGKRKNVMLKKSLFIKKSEWKILNLLENPDIEMKL